MSGKNTWGCLCSTDTVAVTVILRVPPEVVFFEVEFRFAGIFTAGYRAKHSPDVFGGIM